MEAEWLLQKNVPEFIIDAGAEYNIKDVLLIEPRQLIQYQFTVTYETSQQIDFPSTVINAENLTNFYEKLARKEPLKILIYGDSICICANSSGEMNVPPYSKAWYDSAAELPANNKNNFTIINRSVSGTDSKWGADNAIKNIGEEADLLVVGFGMNDGTAKIEPEMYKKHITDIINSRHKSCDFVLISTILPNPDSFANGFQSLYNKPLLEICNEYGGAMLDMTAMSEFLLKTKRYCEISGNNFNHPSDYLYIFYAQALGKILTGNRII